MGQVVDYVSVVILAESSWDLVLVSRHPVKRVSYVYINTLDTWLHPLVVEGVNDLFLAQVFSILKPVLLHDSASVACITTEATLTFIREDNVPFVVDN